MNWNLVIFNKMDTMKKLYYIILGLLVGLVACQENDKTDFDSNGAVYFQVNPSSWSDTRIVSCTLLRGKTVIRRL